MSSEKEKLKEIGLRIVQFLNLPAGDDLKTEAIFSLLSEWEKTVNNCGVLFIQKSFIADSIKKATKESHNLISFESFLKFLDERMSKEVYWKKYSHSIQKNLMKTSWGLSDMDPLYNPAPIELTECVLNKYFTTDEDHKLLDEIFKKAS